MMEFLVFVRLCGSAGLEQKKVGGRRKASTASTSRRRYHGPKYPHPRSRHLRRSKFK